MLITLSACSNVYQQPLADTDTDVWIGAQLDEDYNVNRITNGAELDDSFIEYSSGESSEAASYIKMCKTDTDDKLIA